MSGHLTEDELLAHLAAFAGNGGATSYATGGPVDEDEDTDERDDQDEDDRSEQQTERDPTIDFSAKSQDEGMSDADMGISDAQMSGGKGDALSDEDMGLSDADMEERSTKKETPTQTFGKHALHEVPSALGTLPAIGAMAEAGASIGAVGGPFGVAAGGVLGGLVGAVSGGYITSKIMQKIYEMAGLTQPGAYFDPEQMEAGAKQNPISAAAGDIAPNVAGFRFDKGASIGARVAGALLQGGLEGGQELAQGELDPARLFLSTAAGAALTKPRGFADRLMGAGARVSNLGKEPTAGGTAGGGGTDTGTGADTKPGRPNVEVTENLAAERDNVDQNDLTTTARGVAAENPPVNTNVDAGNPQSSPVRSERLYPKDKAANDNATGTGGVTMKDGLSPDVQSAFDALSKRTDVANPETPEFKNGAPETQALGRMNPDELVQTSQDQRAALDQAKTSGNGELPADAYTADQQNIPSNARPTEHVTVKGDEPPPGPVYDHPELPGVKVDRTAMVPNLADVAPDGKTVHVDNRIPPLIDVAGKKLDAALPLGVRAKVQHEVYNGPGVTRKLAKEAGMAAEKTWLESRGYDYDAYKKALRQTQGPVAKPGDTAIAQARKLMEKMPKALAKFDALPPEQQAQFARKTLEMSTNKRGKVASEYASARVPAKPATVEGVGTSARTKAEAAMRSNVVKAANEAFDRFQPKEGEPVPTSKDQKDALRARLTMALEHVSRAGNYMPRDKSVVPALKWIKDARSLLKGRMSQKQIAQFIANEKLLRSGNPEAVKDVVQTGRIEGDISRSRTPDVETAENTNAARNDQPITDAEMEGKPGKEIDWANLTDEDLEDMAKARAAADAALKPKVEKAVPAWKKAEEERATKMAAQKAAREGKGGITATVKKFAENEEGGAPIPEKLVNAGKAVKEFLSRKPSEDYISASPKSPEEQYARSIDDRLYTTDKTVVNNRTNLRNAYESWPEKFRNEKTMGKIYRAMETQDFQHLTPEEKAFYFNELKPIKDAATQMRRLIAEIDPENYSFDERANHVHRIGKGLNPALDDPAGGIAADPIHSLDRSLNTSTSTLKERAFYEMEDKNGNRKVISPTEDGFHIWTRGQSSKVKADIEVKVGNTYTDKQGRDWKIVDALTPNIERNARFRNGKMASYHQNAALSVLKEHDDLFQVLQHMKLLEDLKNDPKFQKLSTRSNNEAKDQGWPLETTKLYPFDKYYMQPELKAVFDHYAQPGFEGATLDKWRNLSRGITKLMFWMPTAHIANVANHWFVARGWDWMNPVAYQRMAVTGAKAIKSVMSQDQLQSMLRDNGAGTIYGGVLNENWLRNMARGVGVEIEKNPSKWDPIVKTLGLKSVKDLSDAIYHGSSKVMWAANDMLYTQHVLELMDKGLSVKQAIQKTDRHIPNYRVPAKVLGKVGFSKIMSDPGFTAFGRYHYGVFNSYAHMIKSAVNGTPEQKWEAIGQMMAIGILGFAVKPVLDKAVQFITGNKDAEVRARGPLALPAHVINALKGKEDFMAGPNSIVSAAPIVNWLDEVRHNRDFANRRVFEPGDARNALGGDMKAAGRVGVQIGEHAARGLISPYGTIAGAWGRGQDPLAAIRDQALDIKEPSIKSLRWQRLQVKRDRSEAAHRAAPGRARGPGEALYNRFTR